jgi:phosphoglycolate phosphatase
MALAKPDIVIFDMDGTTVRHINPRLLLLLEWADDMMFKFSVLRDWLLRRHAKGAIFAPGIIPDFKSQKKPKLIVHRVMHKVRRKDVEQIVEPCPGIYLVLELLARHGIPLGLISNGLGKGYGHDILEKFDLEKYFRATIFREDIKKSKPHPDSLLLALQTMNVETQAGDVVWYIGDRHKDISAALAAGKILPAKFEPIAYGLNAAVAVMEKGVSPDNIIMSYQDMYLRLSELLGEAAHT